MELARLARHMLTNFMVGGKGRLLEMIYVKSTGRSIRPYS